MFFYVTDTATFPISNESSCSQKRLRPFLRSLHSPSFPPGDIWRLEISVKIIRHRSNSSESTSASTSARKGRREADMHCALSSDKRGMKTVPPSGEAFRLGLPFWFTCVDTAARVYRAFKAGFGCARNRKAVLISRGGVKSGRGPALRRYVGN